MTTAAAADVVVIETCFGRSRPAKRATGGAQRQEMSFDLFLSLLLMELLLLLGLLLQEKFLFFFFDCS